MSNEISVTLNARVKNGYLDVPFNVSAQFDQASAIGSGGIQSIGTATNAEFIALGDVTTASFAFLRNLDTTNYIDVGTGTGTSFIAFLRIGPGKFATCWLHPTNAPSARSNVAACNLWYHVSNA